jgi:hypothetical protein
MMSVVAGWLDEKPIVDVGVRAEADPLRWDSERLMLVM